jgi:hypothetical protein
MLPLLIQEKKKERVQNNFTTDYRGKIINFCPKGSRVKDSSSSYGVKIQTLIDTCRAEGKVNLSATARRGGYRDFFQDISNSNTP